MNTPPPVIREPEASSARDEDPYTPWMGAVAFLGLLVWFVGWAGAPPQPVPGGVVETGLFHLSLLDRIPAPAMAIYVPLLGALGIYVAGTLPLPDKLRDNVREGVTLVTALLLLCVVVGIYQGVTFRDANGAFVFWHAAKDAVWTPVWGAEPIVLVQMLPDARLPLALRVEPLGMVMLVVISRVVFTPGVAAPGSKAVVNRLTVRVMFRFR